MINSIIIKFVITQCLHTQMVQYGDDFCRPLQPHTSYLLVYGSLKHTESLLPGCASLHLLPCHLLGAKLHYHVKYFVFGNGSFIIDLHTCSVLYIYIYIYIYIHDTF